jgi:hypothetical protein
MDEDSKISTGKVQGQVRKKQMKPSVICASIYTSGVLTQKGQDYLKRCLETVKEARAERS